MKIKYPEYGRCIANLACSLLKYYGIEPPNSTLEQADALLEKKYKNIVKHHYLALFKLMLRGKKANMG